MATSANIVIDWSLTTTGLVTISKLNAALTSSTLTPTGTLPNWLADTPSPPTFNRLFVVNDVGDCPAWPVSVTVDGSPVSIGRGQWFRVPHDSAPPNESAGLKFHGYPSAVVPPIETVLKFGFVRFQADNDGTQINFDHITIFNPFHILQQQISDSVNQIVAHASVGGGSTFGNPVTIDPSKTYWYQLLVNTLDGTVKVRIQDPDSNYGIIGTSNTTCDEGMDQYADYWGLRSPGACDGQTLWSSAVIVYGAEDFIEVGDPVLTAGLSGKAAMSGKFKLG